MKQIQLMHAYAYIGNICLTFNECFVHAVHLGDIYAMFAECAGTFSVSWVCSELRPIQIRLVIGIMNCTHKTVIVLVLGLNSVLKIIILLLQT